MGRQDLAFCVLPADQHDAWLPEEVSVTDFATGETATFRDASWMVRRAAL